MAGTGNATRARLDTRCPAEVTGEANTSSRVTSDVECCGACRHNSGGTSAAAAGGAGQIIGIVGSAIDQIVGLKGESQLRRVRFSQKNRTGCLQPRHHGGIFLGNKASPSTGPTGGNDSRRVQRILEGHGNTMEGPLELSPGQRLVRLPGLDQSGVRRQQHHRVDPGVHLLDASETGPDHLLGRDFTSPNGARQVDGRSERRVFYQWTPSLIGATGREERGGRARTQQTHEVTA